MSSGRCAGQISTAAVVALFIGACGSSHATGTQGGAGGSGAVGNAGRGGTATATGGLGGTTGSSGAWSVGGTTGSSLACAALPAATGTVVNVTPSDDLPAAVDAATAGTTIVLADGTYTPSRQLNFRAAGVTLRSASDDAQTVVIDGAYALDEIVAITANDVTIAHVTVERAVHHPVHVYPPDAGPDVTGTLLYGLRLIDGGQQFVKVNPNAARTFWVDRGRVECSSFMMTTDGRTHVEPCCGGCYTGGIDVHAGRGWVVRANHFEGIYCAGTGLAEHAIHFWNGARDTLVENNVIIDCARGIGFGLDGGVGERVYSDAPYGGVMLAHYDGIIRNNVIFSETPYYDTGIELDITREPHVLHNTVISTAAATGAYSSIDWRFAETHVVLRNNLATRLTERDSATADLDHNLPSAPGQTGASLSDFVDPTGHDLHLSATAAEAVDQGVADPESGLDIDGEPHDVGAPDLGADERAQ